MIRLENISKTFNGKEVLKDISFKVKKGEMFSVFGPSGCGKTTLLRIIAGLEKPDSGRIYIRGEEATLISPEKRNVSFIFQDLALWPHMSAREHIEFVLSNKSSGQDLEEIKKILKMVGLANHLYSKPEELSGGEKQRLAIARAIAQKSDVFLLDEPLSSLDFSLKKEIKSLLKSLQNKYSLTMVYVAHDILDIIDMCDKTVIIKNGEISKIGKPMKLLKTQLLASMDKTRSKQ